MEKFIKLFLNVCSNSLELQSIRGFMPSGHNGPYYDNETPIRNTSHWIISFIKAFKLTSEEKYRSAAINCLNYLFNCAEYREGYTYIQRIKSGKDVVNGLIGPAWNIESLVKAYSFFRDDRILELAMHLQKIHKFDSNYSLWEICLQDGRSAGIDFTFNHQLWFASSTAELYKETGDRYLKDQLDRFFNNLHNNLNQHNSGLIKHYINRRSKNSDKMKCFLRPVKYFIYDKFKGMSLTYKEKGYHLFSMFAFAKIFQTGYKHSFFQSDNFNKSLSFSFDDKLFNDLLINQDSSDITNLPVYNRLPFNRYGYSYNPPGFEIPFINKVFGLNLENKAEDFFNTQLKFTYNPQEKDFSYNTDDSKTLTARICELSEAL